MESEGRIHPLSGGIPTRDRRQQNEGDRGNGDPCPPEGSITDGGNPKANERPASAALREDKIQVPRLAQPAGRDRTRARAIHPAGWAGKATQDSGGETNGKRRIHSCSALVCSCVSGWGDGSEVLVVLGVFACWGCCWRCGQCPRGRENTKTKAGSKERTVTVMGCGLIAPRLVKRVCDSSVMSAVGGVLFAEQGATLIWCWASSASGRIQ